MKCRHCKKFLKHTFLDLGFAPPSNAYLELDELSKPEIYFPLKIRVCDNCWLVQTEDYIGSKYLFSDKYAYFSSVSSSWLLHAKKYSKKIIKDLKLNSKSNVIEIGSNDGYLLKNFINSGIPCIGIEPTKSTADSAIKSGVKVIRKFFRKKLALNLSTKGKKADLVIANNVYAHVPDINDFTIGLKTILKKNGTTTLEFPHILKLIKHHQFDTIYHEHFSYLSLNSVIRIFSKAKLKVWKVEELSTHGGSIRVYGCHKNDKRKIHKSVKKLLQKEKHFGLKKLKTYLNFQIKVNKIKDNLTKFLIEKKNKRQNVVGYGAAAKGNTILNFAGIKSDLLPAIFDAAKSKQRKYMPGSHIPILNPRYFKNFNPKYILILPWNLSLEISNYIKKNFSKKILIKTLNNFK